MKQTAVEQKTKSFPDMIIGGERIGPRERRAIRLPIIDQSLLGETLAIWVHAIRGSEEGPVVGVLAASHGTEWFSIDPLRRLVESLDPGTMTGTVLVVPVVNPPALALQVRDVPDGSDVADMDRCFGKPSTWTSSQLATAITSEVLSKCTHLIDLRPAPWGCALTDVAAGHPLAPRRVVDEAVRLARASGFPFVRRNDDEADSADATSAVGYASSQLGIPTVTVSIGGPGFGRSWSDVWIKQTVEGLRALLQAVGVCPGRSDNLSNRGTVYRHSYRVASRNGGFLRPKLGPKQLGDYVAKGTLLAEIANPYTFEVIEELRAPAAGHLIGVARAYAVHPGDWAFSIAGGDGTNLEAKS